MEVRARSSSQVDRDSPQHHPRACAAESHTNHSAVKRDMARSPRPMRFTAITGTGRRRKQRPPKDAKIEKNIHPQHRRSGGEPVCIAHHHKLTAAAAAFIFDVIGAYFEVHAATMGHKQHSTPAPAVTCIQIKRYIIATCLHPSATGLTRDTAKDCDAQAYVSSGSLDVLRLNTCNKSQ